MSGRELSAVAYKKGNWMRYTLWAVAAVCIALLLTMFFTVMTGEISVAVPEGYRFQVTDNYGGGKGMYVRYYVYDNKIMVEKETQEENRLDRAVVVYDGIGTQGLVLDDADEVETCELGACYKVPKALVTIKKLISGKMAREYIGW